jgi:hypothetical protein
MRMLDHGRQAYAAATRVETLVQLDGNELVREPGAQA